MFTLQNPSQIELKMLTLFMMHRQASMIITRQIWWQSNTRTVIIKYTNIFQTKTERHTTSPTPASQSLTKTEIIAEKCETWGSSFEYEISGFQSPESRASAETVQMSTWLPVLWMRLKIEFAISCWGFCNMTLSTATQPCQPLQTGWCSIGPDCSTPFNE